MATSVEEEVDLSQYKHRHHELSYLKLDEFRKSNIAWDVTLKSTDGAEVSAQKCVLTSHSKYFQSMFVGGFLETNQDVIHIKDISGEVLKNIVNFLYTGVLVSINQDNVEELLNAADLFQMKDVRHECLNYYLLSMHDKNCLAIKEIADVRAMTTLSEKCLKHALKRFLFIVEHRSFLDADVTHLIQLLENDNLCPPEEEPVYRAVMKWVRHDETKRKHLLPDLLEHVRLVFTSKDFLLQEVTTDPLIKSSPECLKIVKKVIDHFNYKYGEPLSRIITDAKPRINTIRFIIDDMRSLRYYNFSDTRGRSEKGPINLLDYLNDSNANNNLSEFEWNRHMNESNFLAPFNEIWKGNSDNTDDEDSDDEDSDDGDSDDEDY